VFVDFTEASDSINRETQVIASRVKIPVSKTIVYSDNAWLQVKTSVQKFKNYN